MNATKTLLLTALTSLSLTPCYAINTDASADSVSAAPRHFTVKGCDMPIYSKVLGNESAASAKASSADRATVNTAECMTVVNSATIIAEK